MTAHLLCAVVAWILLAQRAALAVTFEVSSPGLSASTASSGFYINAPTISANTDGSVFEISAPALVADTGGARFELLAPALVADAGSEAFLIRGMQLSALFQPASLVAPLASAGERKCMGMYQCWDKFTIRNAIKDTSYHHDPATPGFCREVEKWLGRAECHSQASRDSANSTFGFPYSEETMNCPPLKEYMASLQKHFDAGGETEPEEQALEKAFLNYFYLLPSGQQTEFCVGMMRELNAG
ncbi:MAG: hypothetical protein AAGG55_01220 [Pseudomonadota bacterium]